MTTTKEALRTNIRNDLKDLNEASYQWSDNLLDLYINDAIQDYSVHFPFEKTVSIVTSASVQDYDWPDDFMSVVRVEYPEGFLLRKLKPKSGTVIWPYLSFQYSYGYEDYGDQLHLLLVPDAGQAINVRYLAYRALPEDDEDDLDVPDRDMQLLRLYVMAECYARTAGQDARLSRWKDDGKRDDNPVLPLAKAYRKQYDDMVEQRKRNVRMKLVRGS